MKEIYLAEHALKSHDADCKVINLNAMVLPAHDLGSLGQL